MDFWTILAIAAALATIVAIIARRDWGLLQKALFALVTVVERELGPGTGALKLAEVIRLALPHISVVLKLVLSEEKLESVVEAALASAKEAWARNPKLLGSRPPGETTVSIEE
ncbi:MAG: hypothetical protein LBU47_01455 [Christensenellaceae bacterium]|jgi:SAM-dependent MidA family methyltransferase|nr:hypothetical protein [Christensenellaceae bacterium]